MQRAVLIFNPFSGRQRGRRQMQVEAAAAVLRAAGVAATLVGTPTAGVAGELAAQAIAGGADTVFACGGDGTVHEVVQGMVGTDAALGVIPLGTANSLACDLGLPRNAAEAARVALQALPHRIAVGRVQYRTPEGECASRYFIMNAGIGMDALMFYRMNALWKQHVGMTAYYFEAFRQWCTARYEFFECEFANAAGETRRERVTQAMAVRVADFGGVVGKLVPGADLRRPDLRLLLFKTARRTDYLRFILRTAVGSGWTVPGVELADAVQLRCEPCSSGTSKIYVEADGELLGTLPVEVEMPEQQIALLMPA